MYQSSTPSVEGEGLSLSIDSSLDVQGVSHSTFGKFNFRCQNADRCSASDKSGTGMNKNADDGPRSPNLMTPQFADL